MHCVFYFAVMIFTNELKAHMEIFQKILAWDKKRIQASCFDSRWRLQRNRNTAAQNTAVRTFPFLTPRVQRQESRFRILPLLFTVHNAVYVSTSSEHVTKGINLITWPVFIAVRWKSKNLLIKLNSPPKIPVIHLHLNLG